MTLAEVLVALAIFVVIMLAIATFGLNISSFRTNISGSFTTAQDAQVILKTLLTEIREAAPGVNGAYPIISVSTSTLSFFSDSDKDGKTEQIKYILSNNMLYRTVIKPSGTPASYNIASQATSSILYNIRNLASVPVFQYYDENYTGTSSALTLPTNISNIRIVQITVTLDIGKKNSPVPRTYTTQASIRNLKTNL